VRGIGGTSAREKHAYGTKKKKQHQLTKLLSSEALLKITEHRIYILRMIEINIQVNKVYVWIGSEFRKIMVPP